MAKKSSKKTKAAETAKKPKEKNPEKIQAEDSQGISKPTVPALKLKEDAPALQKDLKVATTALLEMFGNNKTTDYSRMGLRLQFFPESHGNLKIATNSKAS